LVGNGLLTFIDKKTQFNKFFKSNEIIFYNSISDLAKKIIKYSNNDKLRAKIAERGQKKYLKHFNSKLDFILHSIGMSINVRKGKHYTDLNYDWMSKGSDVSAVSFHKLMQTLYKSDAMNKWGSIIALSYIAAQRIFPNYNDMADNKALLESIARSFGYFFGKSKQVRVNTISQSPTITTAGKGVKGFNEFLSFSDKLSPLGNASSEDCANYIVAMFSDYTKKVTLQNLYNDGGYSSVGVSQEILDIMKDRTE